MRKVLMFSVLAVLFLGGATVASADCGACDKKEDRKSKHCKMFEKKDTNSDGTISKSEFMASAEKKFARIDADGSGGLTKEEVKKYWAAKKKKHKEGSGQCGGK